MAFEKETTKERWSGVHRNTRRFNRESHPTLTGPSRLSLNLLDTARRMGLRHYDHPRAHAAAWLGIAASFRLAGNKQAAREAVRRAVSQRTQ